MVRLMPRRISAPDRLTNKASKPHASAPKKRRGQSDAPGRIRLPVVACPTENPLKKPCDQRPTWIAGRMRNPKVVGSHRQFAAILQGDSGRKRITVNAEGNQEGGPKRAPVEFSEKGAALLIKEHDLLFGRWRKGL